MQNPDAGLPCVRRYRLWQDSEIGRSSVRGEEKNDTLNIALTIQQQTRARKPERFREERSDGYGTNDLRLQRLQPAACFDSLIERGQSTVESGFLSVVRT